MQSLTVFEEQAKLSRVTEDLAAKISDDLWVFSGVEIFCK